MSQTANFQVTAAAAGGGSVSISEQLSVEGLEKIEVEVPASSTDLEVSVGGDDCELIDVLIIKPSVNAVKPPTAADLSYKVNEDTNPAIRLDGPHIFRGSGAATLIGQGTPKTITTLFFTNTKTVDVMVEILVGRDATP